MLTYSLLLIHPSSLQSPDPMTACHLFYCNLILLRWFPDEISATINVAYLSCHCDSCDSSRKISGVVELRAYNKRACMVYEPVLAANFNDRKLFRKPFGPIELRRNDDL